LHGTAGSGTGMLSPAFAGELFGPGQPLDAGRYFINDPDWLGGNYTAQPRSLKFSNLFCGLGTIGGNRRSTKCC